MKRLRLTGGGNYFENPTGVNFINSGCGLLNLVVSGKVDGGWAEGRAINIVGDSSTGKTLLAIEACANFALQHPKGLIRYRDAEAAFDNTYAESIGFPISRLCPEKVVETVEQWNNDLEDFCDKVEGVVFEGYVEKQEPGKGKVKVRKTKKVRAAAPAGLYVLDSLDALGDDTEKNQRFDKDDYGAKKPKLIGKVFRNLIGRLRRLNITLVIISQTRDKIGVMFGETVTRSGGRALQFYCSQVLWLAHLENIELTKSGIKRKVGVWTRAKCKKNKVAPAWQQCDFPILFNYGVGDMKAALQWLSEVKMLNKLKIANDKQDEYLEKLNALPPDKRQLVTATVNHAVAEAWGEIASKFMPPRKKYG